MPPDGSNIICKTDSGRKGRVVNDMENVLESIGKENERLKQKNDRLIFISWHRRIRIRAKQLSTILKI